MNDLLRPARRTYKGKTVWRIECQGTEKRGCGYVVETPLPRCVIFMRCPACTRLRRNLVVNPLEA